jgi:hypothetical protein
MPGLGYRVSVREGMMLANKYYFSASIRIRKRGANGNLSKCIVAVAERAPTLDELKDLLRTAP